VEPENQPKGGEGTAAAATQETGFEREQGAKRQLQLTAEGRETRPTHLRDGVKAPEITVPQGNEPVQDLVQEGGEAAEETAGDSAAPEAGANTLTSCPMNGTTAESIKMFAATERALR